ncbi:UNVERIFIED_CONTAM: AAA15 family ATPase/GTPase [Brevibacillus sp. OAP136]
MQSSSGWIDHILAQTFTQESFDGLEKNQNFLKVIHFFHTLGFTISSDPTYYYYNDNSVDTRANIYYQKIGLFKIYIRVSNINNDVGSITIEKIRRTEDNMRRIQDLSDDLEANWEKIFLRKKYYWQVDEYDKFQQDIIELKKNIDNFTNSPVKIPDKQLVLKKITIYNFKKITKAEINLQNNLNIIVGMNNAGKSSFIQGILLGYQSLYTLAKENRIRFKKNGSINLDTDNNPLPAARIEKFPFLLGNPIDLFNRNSRSNISRGVDLFKFEFDEGLFIKIKARIVGDVFSVFISDCSATISKQAIKTFIERPITLIPSFFNVVINEERKSLARYNSLLKTGNYNQLFRNILYDLKEIDKSDPTNPDDVELKHTTPKLYKFSELQQIIEEVFGIKDLDVKFNPDEDEYISATYQVGSTEDNKQERLDISTLGMGTLQFIQVITQVLSGSPSIIMLDEPDAHLHSKLQVRIINLLKHFSEKYNVKFIVATHSKDIINNVNPRQVLTFTEDNKLVSVDDLDGFIGTVRSLGATTEEIIGLNLGKRIILVEGSDDSTYIKKIYEKFIPDHISSNYNLINFIPLGGRDNVISNNLDKFLGNIGDVSDFKKIAVIDKDYRFDDQHFLDAEKLRKKGFIVIEWKKKELENYLLIPEVIVNIINTKYPQNNSVTVDDISRIIEAFYQQSKSRIVYEFIKVFELRKKREIEQCVGEKFKSVTPGKDTIVEFWDDANHYVESQEKTYLLSGKEVLNLIRTELIIRNTPSQKDFIIDIIDSLPEELLHADVSLLLNEIKSMST